MSPCESSKKYSYGLDIIRIVAMFFVICVHATTFYGFNEQGIYSPIAFLVGMFRFISYSCVPLFLLLTGYLNCRKAPCLNYYLKIVRVFVEFFICGIAVYLFNKLYLGSTMGFMDFALKMLNFTFPSYSWYMAMFVGLFALAPFFNYIVNAIPSNYKIVFVVVLLLLFSNPNITGWWISAYPIMYYFFGAFIRDCKIKVKPVWLTFAILLCSAIQVLAFMYPVIPRYSTSNYMNFGCVIISVSIFLLFKDMTTVSGNSAWVKIIRTIANASFSTFLISEIFESLTVEYFDTLGLNLFSERLPYLLYLTPVKFLVSLACGIAINLIVKYAFKAGAYLICKMKKQPGSNDA